MKTIHIALIGTFFLFLKTTYGMEDGNVTESNDVSGENEEDDLDTLMTEFGKNLKDIFSLLSDRIQPLTTYIASSDQVSLSCKFDLYKVYRGVLKLQPWAFRMLDAVGKPSEGILEGTTIALGDYDECTSVQIPHSKDRRGRYCLLEIRPPAPIIRAIKHFQENKNDSEAVGSDSLFQFLGKIRTNPDFVMLRSGVCVPSTCSSREIQALIDIVLRTPLINVNVAHCESQTGLQLEPLIIFFLIFISICVAVVIVATLLAICARSGFIQFGRESYTDSSPSAKRLATALEAVSKFSIYTSFRKLFDCSEPSSVADVTRGIKVYTVLCTIYLHTYALPHPLHMYRFRDALNFTKFIDELLFETVLNSSVGVDSFFFLAGFYFVYNRWSLLKRPAIAAYILKFIVLTFIRIQLLQTLVVGLFFLLPSVGSGPLWEEFVEQPLQKCRDTWWRNLLLVQNFIGPYDVCLYPSWVLATMMQICVITAGLVYILNRWPVYGIFTNFLVVMISMIAVAVVTIVSGYPATLTVYFYDYRTAIYFWKYLYTQFYPHIGPHCIGMMIAYLSLEFPKYTFRKGVRCGFWFVSLATSYLVMFGLHGYRDGHAMDRSLAVLYAALHRVAWTSSLGWAVYACATGQGGLVKAILSARILAPLEKLCYLAYLIHVPLMYYQGGIQRERIYMSHYNQIMSFLSYTVTSFALSMVCYILFQNSYEEVERLILGKRKGSIWEPADDSSVSKPSNKSSPDTKRSRTDEDIAKKNQKKIESSNF